MLKKMFAVVALALGTTLAAAPEANAAIFYGVAPVRRVAARTVLPPYPVARRVVARPVVAPVYRGPVVYGAPYAPAYYATPGVSVSFGW